MTLSTMKDFKNRILQLQKKLSEEKIEAALITNPINVRYLSNFTGTNGQIVITPKKAFFITDFRYIGVAKKILPSNIKLINAKNGLLKALQNIFSQYRFQQLYFEANHITYAYFQIFKKNLPLQLKTFSNLIENLRIQKSEEEIKLITKAQRISEKVFLEIRKNLKTGQSEIQIAHEIEKMAHDFGADTISFPPIIAFQENSANPHHQPTSRKLKKGNIVLIDMGMQYQGYASDMTRMIFTQKPKPFEKEIYNIVLKAQEESAKKIYAGVKGKDIDHIARKIISDAGYGKTFGHSLGHGIGLEVHEAPSLSTHYEKEIPENTIVTVEPGIYLDKSFGVRIEDMVLVKRNTVQNLTRIPKRIEDSIFLIH